MFKSVSLLLAAVLPLVVAHNHSDDGDDALDGGVIAGIVIGSLAGVGLIAALVYYFYLKPGAMYGSKIKVPTTTGGAIATNNLPMVALKVTDEDDL